jgi:hypothetical protein
MSQNRDMGHLAEALLVATKKVSEAQGRVRELGAGE